jgi:hypothetical protein
MLANFSQLMNARWLSNDGPLEARVLESLYGIGGTLNREEKMVARRTFIKTASLAVLVASTSRIYVHDGLAQQAPNSSGTEPAKLKAPAGGPLDRFFGGTGGTPQDLVQAGGTAEGYWWDRRAQGHADRTKRNRGGPTSPTRRYYQNSAELPAVPPVPPVPPVAGLSCQSEWR